MVYVKADVDDETHETLRMRAAKENKPLEEVTANLLESVTEEDNA
jgi:plasmid stability protein